MKLIYSGLESSGKSLMLAKKIYYLIDRNAKWYLITKKKRPIHSNLKLAKHVEEYAKKKNVVIKYWKDLEELVLLQDCDIIIDEVGNYFDARRWAELSIDARKWLTQGAKRGIEMYGTSQDFAQVDKSFRRLTNYLYHITKIMGSMRPTPTRPPVKHIWGLCMVQMLNPRVYHEDKEKFDSTGIPSFFFIRREDTELYDTRQSIEVSEMPPFRHTVRKCPTCDFEKITHA